MLQSRLAFRTLAKKSDELTIAIVPAAAEKSKDLTFARFLGLFDFRLLQQYPPVTDVRRQLNVRFRLVPQLPTFEMIKKAAIWAALSPWVGCIALTVSTP